jgi:hypothetical protein
LFEKLGITEKLTANVAFEVRLVTFTAEVLNELIENLPVLNPV